MRILYLCCDPGIPVFGRKGASSHVRGTCRALSVQGHDVQLVCTNIGGDSQNTPDVTPIVVRGSESKKLGFDTRRILLDRKFYKTVKRHIERKGKPDAIYERYSLYSRAGQRIARDYGLPHILEINAFLSEEQRDRIRFPALARWYERRIVQSCTNIFVVSEPLKEGIREISESEVHIEVEPMSVDTETFNENVDGAPVRERLGLGEDFVIGYVGTLSGWHGIRLLYEIAAELEKRGLSGFRFLVVGGDGNKLQKHRTLTRENGLEDVILFHGDVPHLDIPRYIRAMDIGIIPDANPWNAPTKLFEYQACGIPPIGPDYPGVRSSMVDGVEGLIFPPKDIGAITDCIVRLHGEPDLRAEMGRLSRKRAVHTRSWNAAALKIVKNFQDQMVQKD